MTDDDVRPARRRNTPLTAMVFVGIVTSLGGLFGAVLCYFTILSRPLDVTAAMALQIATSLAGFGILLLLIAWIIAASRFK